MGCAQGDTDVTEMPSTFPNVPAAVAWQTTLCPCPCVPPSWHLHLDMHVGMLHLKPSPFSRKGDVTHVIRYHFAVKQLTGFILSHAFYEAHIRSASLCRSPSSPGSLLCAQPGVQELHGALMCIEIFCLPCSGNSSARIQMWREQIQLAPVCSIQHFNRQLWGEPGSEFLPCFNPQIQASSGIPHGKLIYAIVLDRYSLILKDYLHHI